MTLPEPGWYWVKDHDEPAVCYWDGHHVWHIGSDDMTPGSMWSHAEDIISRIEPPAPPIDPAQERIVEDYIREHATTRTGRRPSGD